MRGETVACGLGIQRRARLPGLQPIATASGAEYRLMVLNDLLTLDARRELYRL
jgi:hypothetical protein